MALCRSGQLHQTIVHSLKARGGQTYIRSEDRLYKAHVHIDGGGQFKKFTAQSSSRVLPLFYILLRVNIDVKI